MTVPATQNPRWKKIIVMIFNDHNHDDHYNHQTYKGLLETLIPQLTDSVTRFSAKAFKAVCTEGQRPPEASIHTPAKTLFRPHVHKGPTAQMATKTLVLWNCDARAVSSKLCLCFPYRRHLWPRSVPTNQHQYSQYYILLPPQQSKPFVGITNMHPPRIHLWFGIRIVGVF